MTPGTDKDSNQKFGSVCQATTENWPGECNMALSIPATPAAGVENTNRKLLTATQSFSEGLERLSSSLRASGTGLRPADYGGDLERTQRVQAAELGKNVRDANDAVHEARTANEGLSKLDVLLGKARGLAFRAINEPSRREREQDQVEYSEVLKEIEGIAASLIFGGGPLLEGSGSFGVGAGLQSVDLTSFQGSIGAIQIIDRAVAEVTDQRGLLGIFQSSKLDDAGKLLRDGLGGVITSSSVVRDRTVAVRLAQSVAADLGRQGESSLFGSGNAAGQIPASQVELLLKLADQAIAGIERGQVEDLLEAQHSIYGLAQGATTPRCAVDQKVLLLCEYCLDCLCYGRREEEWAAVSVLTELRRGLNRVLQAGVATREVDEQLNVLA